MANFTELVDLVKTWAPLATLFAAPPLVLGVVPRVGPLRAFVLFLKPLLFRRPSFVSTRQQSLEFVSSWLKTPQPSYDEHLIILGPKGAGKTVLIETVTSHRPGVVDVNVSSGDSHKEITNAALKAITNAREFAFFPLESQCRRVLFWYRLIPFAPPPLVCFQINEVQPGKEMPDITAAVKNLVHNYKVQVIVDCPDHSLPDGVLNTKRQMVLSIEEMTPQEVMADPKFQQLFISLKAQSLDKVVWAVCGGNPLLLMRCIHEGAAAVVVEELNLAIKHCNQFENERLLEEFKTKDEVNAGKIVLPRNKVLRERSKLVDEETIQFLVPATPAIKVVLQMGLDGVPRLEVLKKMFESSPTPIS